MLLTDVLLRQLVRGAGEARERGAARMRIPQSHPGFRNIDLCDCSAVASEHTTAPKAAQPGHPSRAFRGARDEPQLFGHAFRQREETGHVRAALTAPPSQSEMSETPLNRPTEAYLPSSWKSLVPAPSSRSGARLAP